MNVMRVLDTSKPGLRQPDRSRDRSEWGRGSFEVTSTKEIGHDTPPPTRVASKESTRE